MRTSDPNITDSFVEETFGLPQNCVKVISAQAGALYRKYRTTVLQRANAGIVHDGRIQNFLRSVAACATLQNGAKLLTVLHIAAGSARRGAGRRAVLHFGCHDARRGTAAFVSALLGNYRVGYRGQ